MSKIAPYKESSLTKRREPFRFMLLLGILGSLLIFTVLLAIYAVRKSAEIYWTQVPLPSLFWVSTMAIITSSGTLHLAQYALRTDKFVQYRFYIAATLLLSILFIVLQLLGWKQLIDAGISTMHNPSVGFIYLLSGVHLAHILVGILALVWAVYKAFKNYSYIDSFVFSVNPPNQLKLRLLAIYWHFVDALWIGIFLFLLFHHGV